MLIIEACQYDGTGQYPVDEFKVFPFILTEPQLLLSDIEEVLFDKLQNKILQ